LRNIRILKQFTLYINKKWRHERIVRVTDFQKYAVFDERNPMPQYLVMICLKYNSRIPRLIPKLIGSLSEIVVPMPTFLMPLSLDIHPIPEMYTMKPGEIMIVDLSENGMVGMFPTQFDVPEGKKVASFWVSCIDQDSKVMDRAVGCLALHQPCLWG
jgi:hypothetical protein